MSSCHHGDTELVELRPFVHQVGGHTCVLEINSRTICKPYQKRELWFYKNEPDALKEFTPKYLGKYNSKCLEVVTVLKSRIIKLNQR